ncbi:Cell cycle control protein 50A P4-ATPase flippase complex beta subunit TMEM30A [Triplophysa tibetana]|uniref:Cell cycle control protein n=1 Tax=Triplophysa tibetana TaxID=1572043 RepID=A0A5A9P3F6_9TELE|nr:Cell cycle control protein 50A P4-ATPase flippase complex beta subunit TMEM30A [Triplophysa tibetana]
MVKKQAGTGPLSRRPDNSAFKQQRLPAWSPSLTAKTVLPTFYILSLVCLLLGIWLVITVENTYQLKVDYTNSGSCERCFELRKNATNAKIPCQCFVNFIVPKLFQGDVFFYYGLRNFHQNLRRYMDSRDDAQMVGRKKNLKTPSSYCAPPFDYDAGGVPIAPCGAVANSLFNDSFSVTYHPTTARSALVPLYRKGIAWYTDKNVKFRNPPTNGTFTLQQAFEGTTRPLYWQRPVYDLDQSDPLNNGFINDDLIIWMREAAFPNFKKLYGVLSRSQGPFTEGLPAGNYSISINYNYPVEYFRGGKEVVISTVSWFGGQNHFLPIAYLVTSGLILVTSFVLTAVYVKVGKKGKNMEE